MFHSDKFILLAVTNGSTADSDTELTLSDSQRLLDYMTLVQLRQNVYNTANELKNEDTKH